MTSYSDSILSDSVVYTTPVSYPSKVPVYDPNINSLPNTTQDIYKFINTMANIFKNIFQTSIVPLIQPTQAQLKTNDPSSPVLKIIDVMQSMMQPANLANLASQVKQVNLSSIVSQVNPLILESSINPNTQPMVVKSDPLKFTNILSLKNDINNKYCSDTGDNIKCYKDAIGTWEKLKFENIGNKQVILKGGKLDKYCSDIDTKVTCNKDNIGSAEQNIYNDLGNNKMTLQSNKHNLYCSVKGDNFICNKITAGNSEIFTYAEYK